MLERAREIFLLSLAVFLFVSSLAVGYGTYTVFSRRGEWVGGIVHNVLSDKGKQALDIPVIVERATDKILKRVLADDERLHVLPLIERLLDRILERIVQKLMSNEGQVLFKSLRDSGEIDRIVLKVTDHLLIHRKEQVIQILRGVVPVQANRLAQHVVSHVVRRDKEHMVELVSRLATRLTKQSKEGGIKGVVTSVFDHVLVKHQERVTDILRKVLPVDLKAISQRLLQQLLERNRKDVAELTQTVIVNLTRKIRQGEVERLAGNVLSHVLTKHKKDIVDIAHRAVRVDLERMLYRVTDQLLRKNKQQLVFILREVLKIDLGKLLAAPFQKKKKISAAFISREQKQGETDVDVFGDTVARVPDDPAVSGDHRLCDERFGDQDDVFAAGILGEEAIFGLARDRSSQDAEVGGRCGGDGVDAVDQR
jgi:hypothetical protein